MTIGSALSALSNYPIPSAVVQNIVEGSGLGAEDEASIEIRKTNAFKRATANIYSFLATAPNVSQGGMTFSFSASERQLFQKKASLLLTEIDEADTADIQCGYIDEDF